MLLLFSQLFGVLGVYIVSVRVLSRLLCLCVCISLTSQPHPYCAVLAIAFVLCCAVLQLFLRCVVLCWQLLFRCTMLCCNCFCALLCCNCFCAVLCCAVLHLLLCRWNWLNSLEAQRKETLASFASSKQLIDDAFVHRQFADDMLVMSNCQREIE